MEGTWILETKKSKIVIFTKTKVTKIDDINVNKILVSREEPYGQKILSNTLLDTMTMTLLDHYA